MFYRPLWIQPFGEYALRRQSSDVDAKCIQVNHCVVRIATNNEYVYHGHQYHPCFGEAFILRISHLHSSSVDLYLATHIRVFSRRIHL